MNRIILIGNGFDLAHGLKTSYKDFIEYLWVGIYDELQKKSKDYINLNKRFFEDKNHLIEINNIVFHLSTNFLKFYVNEKAFSFDSVDLKTPDETKTKSIKAFIDQIKETSFYQNNFFKIISDSYFEKNWSDIEADYYRELKQKKDDKDAIEKLNNDFNQIKELLAGYLKNLEEKGQISEITSHIYSSIKIKHVKLSRLDFVCDYLKSKIAIENEEFKNILRKITGEVKSAKINTDLINPQNILKRSSAMINMEQYILPESVLFLNFNYTSIINQYKEDWRNPLFNQYTKIEINQIHGSYNSPEDMIFGYGDEEDESYKELEMSDTPGLLDNVKSINYLKSRNYRDLERFMEAEPYQIFIMGMSCGLSDRTMLRKLFQHKNCFSVVPFYYKDKKTGCDNFNELSQNISRCFSDKDLLRSLVVNKTDCEPLIRAKK